ncbi:MAG: rhodanese-like domain-containing protein [Pseudomonadota bacterium]
MDRADLPFFISAATLIDARPAADIPRMLDVRRPPAVTAEPVTLPTAVWRDLRLVPHWASELGPRAHVIVFCVHGHNVSQGVTAQLRQRGRAAQCLAGGLHAWRAAGGPLVGAPQPDVSDAISVDSEAELFVAALTAAPADLFVMWSIARFVDREARFLFVAEDQVAAVAADLDAVPVGSQRGGVPTAVQRLPRADATYDAMHARVRRPDETGLAAAVSEIWRHAQNGNEYAALAQTFVVYDAHYQAHRRAGGVCSAPPMTGRE